jgi:hypothetical protein
MSRASGRIMKWCDHVYFHQLVLTHREHGKLNSSQASCYTTVLSDIHLTCCVQLPIVWVAAWHWSMLDSTVAFDVWPVDVATDNEVSITCIFVMSLMYPCFAINCQAPFAIHPVCIRNEHVSKLCNYTWCLEMQHAHWIHHAMTYVCSVISSLMLTAFHGTIPHTRFTACTFFVQHWYFTARPKRMVYL